MPHELAIFWSAKNDAKTLFSTLHPLSLVLFATAKAVAFVLLRNSRFNFHCYSQCEAMPTQKSAQKWCCDLSQLLAWKIIKGIHLCKPASLNHPIEQLSFNQTICNNKNLLYTWDLQALLVQKTERLQKTKKYQKISDSQKQYQYNIYPKGPTLYSLNTEWGSKHLQLVYRIRVHKTLQLVYGIRVQNFTACLLNKGPKPFSLHTKSRSTVPPRGQHFIAFLQNNRVLFLKWAIFYTFTGYCSPKGPTFYSFHTEY